MELFEENIEIPEYLIHKADIKTCSDKTMALIMAQKGVIPPK